MIDADLFKAIQILALQAIETPDYNAWYRRISRWYSHQFHTPLHVVETLNEITVLQAYFEEKYFELYNSSYEEERRLFQEIKDELLKDIQTISQEQQLDEEWVQQTLAEIQRQENLKNKKNQDNTTNQENPNLIEEKVVEGESEIPPDNE